MKFWHGQNLVWTVLVVAVLCAGAVCVSVNAAAWLPAFGRVSYAGPAPDRQAAAAAASARPLPPPIVHLPPPIPVRSVYITACTASESKLRGAVLAELPGTEINSLVVDVKDYTGTLSYASTSVSVPPGGRGCRIVDLPAFVGELHDRGIYAIARVTVFQDPLYSDAHPELAVASLSHPDRPWADKDGLSYIDPDQKPYWDYIVSIAKESYSIGFDEINFDYIRFPSDGDMSDAHFDLPASTTKAAVIKEFFSYLDAKLKPTGAVISADLFGQTTVNSDDLGIGQVLEDALPYFDFVDPMVYPSHFSDGFDGYANPAADPYPVVKLTMSRAVERAAAASSTPDKLRPWLQAFDYKAAYPPAAVESEKQAVYDSGLSGYMLWNAASEYDVPELMPAPAVVSNPASEAGKTAAVPTAIVPASAVRASTSPAGN